MQVWPGKAVYPDHMNNTATASWLRKHLGNWHTKVPYDGLWLDMNEASNFCSGVQCKPDTSNETAMYCECQECWETGLGWRGGLRRQLMLQLDSRVCCCVRQA